MKKKISNVCIILILLSTFTINLNSVSAQSMGDLQKKINELEKEQKELKSEQNHLNSNKQDTENKLAENETKQNTVKEEINVIDSELTKTTSHIQVKEDEITETSNEIVRLNEEIEQLKVEIEELEDRIEKRESLLKDRLRSIQQNGGSLKYIAVILGAQSFGDFISRSSAVNTIMDQDKTIMEEHTADKLALEDKKQQVDATKVEVEARKATLEQQKGELLALKKQLDGQLAQKEVLMSQLKVEHEHLEEYMMSIEEEQQVLREQEAIVSKAKSAAIKEKEKIEEQSRKASTNADGQKPSSSSNSLSAGGSGILSWPASGRLSSGYGYRSFNGGGIHYGIDIAAPQGTPVYAAASGVVTRANYSPSYGNVIYIYHSDINKTTVYAHLHTMSVSAGTQVGAGQGIGTIGNTGASFGNHLHFEVHNGLWSRHGGVNPMSYLK